MHTRSIKCGKIVACAGMALFVAACGGGGGYGGGGGGGTTGYTVGGTVSGLTGTGLVLLDDGTDAKSITANGAFTFAMTLAYGMTYNVTVKTQPSGPAQTCTVTNGSGTIGYANVTNVTVNCVV